MKVAITMKSGNAKVGRIPVTTSSESTCPSSCPLKGKGCYAELGPISWHWKKVNNKGHEWEKFLHAIQSLKAGQLWRHNQAGDLAGDGEQIDKEKLLDLCEANKGLKGFTYTHYKGEGNYKAIKEANDKGFTINLSADHIDEVDALVDLNIAPVVVVMPVDFNGIAETKKGRKILACPASIGKVKDCATCKVCQVSGRKTIIGFPAHGIRKHKIKVN